MLFFVVVLFLWEFCVCYVVVVFVLDVVVVVVVGLFWEWVLDYYGLYDDCGCFYGYLVVCEEDLMFEDD